MAHADGYERITVNSAEELDRWLAAHHGRAQGVWLVTWKKHCGAAHVSRETVLDALIAWGWIDGARSKLDADRTMQLVTPRRQRLWAASYRARAERLIREGRMQPPGAAAIARARQEGTWLALVHVDALEIPADLAAALDALPDAAAAFAAAPPSYRRNVLRWIAGARRPKTRATRIARTAEAARDGRRIANL